MELQINEPEKSFTELLNESQTKLKKLLNKYQKFSNIEIIQKLRKEIEFLEEILIVEDTLFDNNEYVCFKRIKQIQEMIEKNKDDSYLCDKLRQELYDIQNLKVQKQTLDVELDFIKRIRNTIAIFEKNKNPPLKTIAKLHKVIDERKMKFNITSENKNDYHNSNLI